MKKSLLAFFSLLFSTILLSQTTDLNIKLRSGNLMLEELDNQIQLGSLNAQTDYFIVQFDHIPDAQQKVFLNNKGVELLEYLPEYAFLVNLGSAQNDLAIGSLGIRSLTPYEASYKLPSGFTLEDAPDYMREGNNKYRIMVDRQLDVDAAVFASFLEINGITIAEIGTMSESFKIIINKDKINWLAAQEEVKFINYAPAPPEKEDTRARSLHTNNMLDSDDPMGRNYDGDGVNIAIADNGLGDHIDLQGRLTRYTTTNNGTHGDMTTGIAVGAGNIDPTIRGMATGAYLHYYDISGYPHINQAANNFNLRGVVITSTSFSQGCNAGYTSDTRNVDLQTGVYPSILHVFSAGNSAGSSCGGNAYGAGTPWGTITGGIKQGKSVIATANLDYRGILTASSSRGPAADGRIKPDISANGTNQMSLSPNNNYAPGGGTSAAAPSIAGIAAQIYQGYRNINSNSNPEASLVKAAMLNTATDIGNVGPDFFYGWGRVNANRAMKLLEDNRYINSSIAQNGNNSHTITVANNLEELRVMVYWNDAAGSVASSKALVNDIDIRVVTPNNDTLLPWVLDPTPNSVNLSRAATRGIDDLNNVEQVVVDTASAGTYTVLVNGKTIPQGPQSYHVIWETVSDSIIVTYPSGGEAFNPGELETIRWDAFGNIGNFTVEYSSNNGTSWNNIASLGGAFRYVNWVVPNITSGDVLVRVRRTGSVTGVSYNSFSIMEIPPRISPSYTCPDSVNLSWDTVAGATNYNVYLLGNKYMDSVGNTTTNDLTLYNLNLLNDNWYAVKARGNGIQSRRSIARLIPSSTLNCPIPYDFAITQISSPSTDYIVSCGSQKQAVRITIHNAGDSILTNIPVKLRNGNNLIYDTIPGPLSKGAFAFYTFRDSLTLSSSGFLTISAIGNLAADANELNDSVAKTIEVIQSSVFSLPYSNDFENFNLCVTSTNCGGTTCNLNGGWTNVRNTSDNHDMRVNSGTTASANTGPSTDHNPGTASGKYIYAESSGGCNGLNSEVITPCFDLSNTINPEFSFWYHMNGATMGIIRLDIFSNGVWINNIITPLFGNQGNLWRNSTVNLNSYAGQTVALRFKFITGSSFTSDMAIDNVSLVDQGVGLAENKNQDYKLYPNPSNGFFKIQMNEGNVGDVRVFDLQGRTVFSTTISSSYGELDLNNLDKGLYLIELNEGKRQKLIIQ